MFDYNQIIDFDRGKFIQIDVGLEPTFPIFFGYDIEDHFIEALERETRPHPVDRVFLLTDPFIFDLFGNAFLNKINEDFLLRISTFFPEGKSARPSTSSKNYAINLLEKGKVNDHF